MSWAFKDEISIPTILVREKVLDLEILYLLNLRPKRASELRDLLESMFRVKASDEIVASRISYLVSSGLARMTVGSATQADKWMYSLTPKGAKEMDEGIQSLSEIALTMQLSLTQPLVKG
ncbi:MAG: hypothetical protein JRN52_05805 [Nitrososphaerota archaeon]|nr:hypothetical protein [Nitrososphaerota archaeon]